MQVKSIRPRLSLELKIDLVASVKITDLIHIDIIKCVSHFIILCDH